MNAPNPTDRHVGARMRMRRLMLGITQEKLAGELGISFQQIQKYEKGRNRISASRLRQIAHILQVTEAWFFEGAEDPAVAEFLATRDGLRLTKAFLQLSQPRRANVLKLIKTIADEKGGG